MHSYESDVRGKMPIFLEKKYIESLQKPSHCFEYFFLVNIVSNTAYYGHIKSTSFKNCVKKRTTNIISIQ